MKKLVGMALIVLLVVFFVGCTHVKKELVDIGGDWTFYLQTAGKNIEFDLNISEPGIAFDACTNDPGVQFVEGGMTYGPNPMVRIDLLIEGKYYDIYAGGPSGGTVSVDYMGPGFVRYDESHIVGSWSAERKIE